MTFTVLYYDVPLATIVAPTRTAAVIQMGYRFGGQAGLRLVESA